MRYGSLYAGLCQESLAAVVEYDRNDVGGILAVINCATLRVSDTKQKLFRQVEPRTSSVMVLLCIISGI